MVSPPVGDTGLGRPEELIFRHFPKNILCAVNQEMAAADTIVNEDDEVAFFPPVTGG